MPPSIRPYAGIALGTAEIAHIVGQQTGSWGRGAHPGQVVIAEQMPTVGVFPQEQVVVVRFGKTDGPVDSWDEVAMAIADRFT
jgi:hypothetical protein